MAERLIDLVWSSCGDRLSDDARCGSIPSGSGPHCAGRMR